MRQVTVVAMLLFVACGSVKQPGDASIDALRMDGPVDGPVDGPPQFTSCMGLAATCGFGANESCCRAEPVPGGTFYRSYDVATDNYNDMGYPATVSSFVLDTYEVTVGRFRKFVNAGMGTQASPPVVGSGAHPKLAGSGWDSNWSTMLTVNAAVLNCESTYQTWTNAPGANENKPMGCVSWYEAMAFCIWDGGYLPTEAEWNYAASGGGEQRAYPWSNPASSTLIDCTYANYDNGGPSGMYCVNGYIGGANRVGSESFKGDGKWSHSDLEGNVVEWTLDWYVSIYPLPCNDCANLTTTSSRVIRGGFFLDEPSSLRVAVRSNLDPFGHHYGIGFRCARNAP
jgi:formylglycine-generating enzyme